MKFIAHRGYWLNSHEKNTAIAFNRALENGFGIETDFRDHNGELVISHDIPLEGVMNADEFIEIYRDNPVSAPIALNIKSDGLQNLVDEFMEKANFKNAFVFDMAVPDMRIYLKKNIRTFMRMSEYEIKSTFLNECQGVWLDAFENEWYNTKIIKSLINKNKQVIIVSSELHGRSCANLWNFIKENNFHKNELVSICTDYPMDAKEYFYESN